MKVTFKQAITGAGVALVTAAGITVGVIKSNSVAPVSSPPQTTVVRTVQPNKDTLITTTTISTVTHPYIPPVVVTPPPVITPPVTGYKPSPSIALTTKDNGRTISGLSFTGSTAITINGAQNIHITKCKFENINSYVVLINKGSANITVDSCFFHNVAFGVYANNAKTIKVNNNQCLNLVWNGKPTMYAHFAQLDNVNSGGNQINYNKIENILGQAYYPHDQISVYESSGLPGDSIQVIGNWIRGGQTVYPSANAGGAGIGLGDMSGSYQVCRGNILVNPGAGGIQPIGNGAGIGIKIDHNTIFSDGVKPTVAVVAISIQRIKSVDCSYNRTNWKNAKGNNVNTGPTNTSQYWFSGASPTGLTDSKGKQTNQWMDLTLTAQNALPATIITMK